MEETGRFFKRSARPWIDADPGIIRTAHFGEKIVSAVLLSAGSLYENFGYAPVRETHPADPAPRRIVDIQCSAAPAICCDAMLRKIDPAQDPAVITHGFGLGGRKH